MFVAPGDFSVATNCPRLFSVRLPNNFLIFFTSFKKFILVNLALIMEQDFVVVNELALGSIQTSQELRMLSSVTLNCQVTKIVMDSDSQL